MLAYVFYSPILAPLMVVATAPVYLVLFPLGARICRGRPWLDMRWKFLATAALAVSVLPGLAIAHIWTCDQSGSDLDDLLAWFPCYVGVFWGAIVIPRWLFDSLHLGAFGEPSGEVSEGG